MRVNHKLLPAKLRKTVLDMAYSGGTVHIGCAFSIIEILAVLYRRHVRFPDGCPSSSGRDFLALSKGHGVMAQYACLYELGWLSAEDIEHYFKDGTRLKGLADARVPGVEVTGGSLGHGLSVAVGFALAAKLSKRDQCCFAIIGDGEANEGAIWEAFLFAHQFKLDNLIVLVDKNDFQAMGSTDEVLSLGDLGEKITAFGFDVLSVDGHSENEIDVALTVLKGKKNGRPKAIVAQTVKGKGVSFMENNNAWHYTRLNADTYASAVRELNLDHETSSFE